MQELDLNILKALITNKKNALDFVAECDEKLFDPDAFNFAKTIINYIKTYKEVPTLKTITDKLTKSNNLKLLETSTKIWQQLESHSFNDKEFKYNVENIKNRFSEKKIKSLKEVLNKYNDNEVAGSLSTMQKTIQEIKALSQAKSFERKTLKESIQEFKDKYNAKLSNPEYDRGIKTGYKFLDEATGGLREAELLLVGGETGAGKSTLLLNMCKQIWMQDNTLDKEADFTNGYNIIYFSLEMPVEDCFLRLLSCMAKVATKKIKKAKLNKEESARVKKALTFIKNYPYEFEIVDIPRGATANQIETIYLDAKERYNPHIVGIDYLGLMETNEKSSAESDWLKLGVIAGECHEMGRVNKCVMLSAVQLNRMKPSKDQEEKVGAHRIGRSALILTHANIGLQIETRSNEDSYPDQIVHIIKSRSSGKAKGRLIKDLPCASLIDDNSQTNESTETFTDIDDIYDRFEKLEL